MRIEIEIHGTEHGISSSELQGIVQRIGRALGQDEDKGPGETVEFTMGGYDVEWRWDD